MSRYSYKIYLADITNSRSYLYSLTFNNAKNNLSLKSRELSPLCKCVSLQAPSRVFTSSATNGAALLLVDKISLWLMVLTLGGWSYLNAFVTEENAVPLKNKVVVVVVVLASSPEPPWLALLSLARLIAYLLAFSTIQRETASSLISGP